MFFIKNSLKKLQEQEDVIYKHLNLMKKSIEIGEYFDVYLELMRKNIGNVENQLLYATIFARYLHTFVIEENQHFSNEQISDMRFAAKKMLIDSRNGYAS